MTNIYLTILIATYLLCWTYYVNGKKTGNYEETFSCKVGEKCSQIYGELLERINVERKAIYESDGYDLVLNNTLSQAAFNWAKTMPEGWEYDRNECRHLQQGVSFWEETEGNEYQNVPMSEIVNNFMHKHDPSYTCGVFVTFSHLWMRSVTQVGIGAWTARKKNRRDTGPLKGVQLWVFLHFELPSGFKAPIFHTQTPPPDPDASTATKAFSTVSPLSTTTSLHSTTTPKPESTTASTTEKPDNNDDDYNDDNDDYE